MILLRCIRSKCRENLRIVFTLTDMVRFFSQMVLKKKIIIPTLFIGKFETVGSVTVSSLLLVGAMGIGWHSFDLLVQTIQNSPSLFVSDTTATAAAVVTTHTAESSSGILKHTHGHGGVLDPNAAWFALASVIIKEWLYRASKLRYFII